ncbi:MAG: tetratricopeptide repeat protein, partial [Deltaproteobacteria bacterium]|nr:tetratricopeptide repeat protein [Deltaproteobacteria bacterium]
RHAKAYDNRGLSYSKKGLYDRAIADSNKAIEIDPNLANAYNNRGYAYYKKGHYDHAISDSSKAIEIDPNLAEAYQDRGIVYSEKYGDKKRACSDWNKACELGVCERYNLAKKNGSCE